MKGPFLEGTDVARSFWGLRVLTRVSFTVSEGEIVALIGPNGAGKTTQFNLTEALRANPRRSHANSTRIPRRQCSDHGLYGP